MPTEKKCVECGALFTTKDKRKKFCTRSCAGTHNNRGRKKSKAVKEKISRSLQARYQEQKPLEEQRARNRKRDQKRRGHREVKSILELSTRTTQKILRRMDLPCSRCGWNKAPGDMHHIEGRKISEPHRHSNLSYLCPNCHREAHYGIVPKEELVTFESYVGARWRDFYYN